MKKFQFRLQRILELREKLEEEQQLKLAAASAVYQKLLKRRDAFTAKAEEERSSLAEKMAAGEASISELQRVDSLHREAERLETALRAPMEQARLAMEKEKAEYTRRRRDKRAVEILKEKRLKEYRQAEIREETQILDEISKRPKP